MAVIRSEVGFSGQLGARKITNVFNPSWRWRFAQILRKETIQGFIGVKLAEALGKYFGITSLVGTLYAVHIDGKTGQRTNYGLVSRHLVTTAFVNFMVDNLQAETAEWGDFKYHDSGIGVTAPAIGDTDIETSDGEARVAGSQIEGASANIYKSVGTITYTTTKAITEHGLFSKLTGTTLLDRSTFAAINVVPTDQIEFTYELTCTAGG